MMSLDSSITEDALVDFVASLGGVSFVDLMQHFGAAAQGTRVITWNGDPHLILWGQISASLESALSAAITHQRIYGVVTSPLIYAIDGQLCNFPVAQTLQPHHYHTPHWVPIEFSVWKHLTPTQRKTARSR